jgi:hypothetical protein
MENEDPMKNEFDEEPIKRGGLGKWVLRIGILIVACVVIGAGAYYYYFFYLQAPKPPAPVPKPIAKEIPRVPPPQKVEKVEAVEKVVREEEEKKITPVILPKLGQSDNEIREKAKGLSLIPMPAKWLKIDNIIRRITAAVDSIAEGQSPRASLKFLAPKKNFSVKKKEERLYINPQSYTRYDLMADVFDSLSVEGMVRVFREFEPLFQEAYQELGYKNRNFQDTLIRAIKELLRAPVVKSDIRLEEKVISYSMAAMADEKLEDLSDAQKHLLRMGPKNTAKIQGKLREIAKALGVPENQLPKSRVYYSKVK